MHISTLLLMYALEDSLTDTDKEYLSDMGKDLVDMIIATDFDDKSDENQEQIALRLSTFIKTLFISGIVKGLAMRNDGDGNA